MVSGLRLAAWICALLALVVACGTPSETSSRVEPSAPSPTVPDPSAISESAETAESPVPEERAVRTNLLVITADDMRADELRWMPEVRRRIADTGLVFHNAFSPNPLCCPARASFLTGKLSHNHEVLSHEPPYGFESFADSDTLATRLQDAGYQTALVGKYLNGYGVTRPPTGGDTSSYIPPGWTEWWGSLDNQDGVAGGTYSYFDLRSNVNGEPMTFPGRYTTEVTGEQTRQLIDQFAGTQSPWFIWWTPVAPHHGGPTEPDDPGSVPRSDGFVVPWVTPARPDWVKGSLDALIPRGSGVPAQGSPEADVSDKPNYIRSYPEFTERELEVLRDVSRQRAEALKVLDVEVAHTLDALDAAGESEQTLVVFTSDNGYYLGEHRKRQGKINLHEPSIRIPLVISGPGVGQGSRFTPATVPDLGVTIASRAGVELASPDGVDLLAKTTPESWIRPVVIEGLMPEPQYAEGRARGPEMPYLNTSGIRAGRWKFVRYSTGETELYDLLTDPLELTNLASAPQHSARHAELLRLWDAYALCTGADCVAELPEELQLDSAANQALTLEQERATSAFFGWFSP